MHVVVVCAVFGVRHLNPLLACVVDRCAMVVGSGEVHSANYRREFQCSWCQAGSRKMKKIIGIFYDSLVSSTACRL